MLFSKVLRELIVRPGGFTAAPSHQTIESGKVSARRAPGKVIRRLENGELFGHRAHDELVQSCPILPSDLFNGALKGSRQSQSIVAACSHFYILLRIALGV
jgi:hypothetical protein